MSGAGFPQGRQFQIGALSIQVSSSVVFIAVLIALHGIVSTDRKAGYYRFLFAKPVSPVLYYTQAFFVYMVGLVATMIVFAAMLHTILPTFSIGNFLLYAALIYIAMGGIGFFLSVTTRYDWVILIAVWLGARILRGVYGLEGGWRSKLVELLPPVHRLDDVASSLIGSGSAEAKDVLWLVGYGALFFVLGLVLLRQRQIAE
jgi:ABC-type polysaccharide/polyol phosphate export permease